MLHFPYAVSVVAVVGGAVGHALTTSQFCLRSGTEVGAPRRLDLNTTSTPRDCLPPATPLCASHFESQQATHGKCSCYVLYWDLLNPEIWLRDFRKAHRFIRIGTSIEFL
jgi:hypothetical protein